MDIKDVEAITEAFIYKYRTVMSDIRNRQHRRKEHVSGYIKSILFTIKSKIVNYTTDQFSTKIA